MVARSAKRAARPHAARPRRPSPTRPIFSFLWFLDLQRRRTAKASYLVLFTLHGAPSPNLPICWFSNGHHLGNKSA